MYIEKIAEQLSLAVGTEMPREVLSVNWSNANNRIEVQVTELAFKQEFTDQGIKGEKTLQSSGNWHRLSFITKSGGEIFTLKEVKGPLYRVIDGKMIEVKK